MPANLSTRRRRATVLMTVVGLLALLFVIVAAFLQVARFSQQTRREIQRGDRVDTIVNNVVDMVSGLVAGGMRDSRGKVLGGAGGDSYADIPGYGPTAWLGSLEPVWNFSDELPWQGGPLPPQPSLPTGDWQRLIDLVWPAVSSLSGDANSAPRPFAIFQLMLEDPSPTDTNALGLQREDVQRFVLLPFTDADGDGVPDADFLSSGRATELANAVGGVAIALPEHPPLDANGDGVPDTGGVPALRLYAIPTPAGGLNAQRQVATWQDFNQRSRYVVAVRVVSHGGMLALDAPTLRAANGQPVAPPRRAFIVDLFNVMADLQVGGQAPPLARLNQLTRPEVNRIFDELDVYRGPVEQALRRRGGLLPGPQLGLAGDDLYRRVPPVLSVLEREHEAAFMARFELVQSESGALENWRPINLGLDPDGRGTESRRAWATVASLNPVAYNSVGGGGQQAIGARYDLRHLMTTTSDSDELARKLKAAEPPTENPRFFDPMTLNAEFPLATYRGEQKFYLGEIGKAFDEVSAGQYRFNRQRGRAIIQRLAQVFGDMLSPYGDWTLGDTESDVLTDSPAAASQNKQVLSARQQAFMLAVNAVAFAAPRDTAAATQGWIDVASYADGEDWPPTGTQPDGVADRFLEYVGFAPQPFFSEVVAYREPNPSGPSNLALVVELFNPGDPHYGGTPPADVFARGTPPADVFALNPAQFAVSIGRGTDPNLDPMGARWRPLVRLPSDPAVSDFNPLPGPIAGRSFLALHIQRTSQSNSQFATLNLPTADLEVPKNDEWIVLKLWRRGQARVGNNLVQRWYCVDLIRVEDPDRAAVDPTQDPAWTSRWRDTSPLLHFGQVVDSAGQPRLARWAVPVAWNDADMSTGAADVSGNSAEALGQPDVNALRDAIAWTEPPPGNLNPERQFGAASPLPPVVPQTPLITMNAGPVGGAGPLSFRLANLAMFDMTPGNPLDDDLRPRSFPTVGFMMFLPRYAHVHRVDPGGGILGTRPASQTLDKERQRRN